MSRTRLHSARPQRRQINWFVIIMALMFLLAAFKLGEQAFTYHDLSQDPSYVEKLAREDLGMTKDGEIPYIYQKK